MVILEYPHPRVATWRLAELLEKRPHFASYYVCHSFHYPGGIVFYSAAAIMAPDKDNKEVYM